MISKFDSVIRFLQSADIIENGNGDECSVEVNGNNELTIIPNSKSLNSVYFKDIVEKTISTDGNAIVIDGDYYLCKRVEELTPPLDLLTQDDLYNIFDEIANNTDSEMYEGYSGRGMYGKQCWGITTSNPDNVLVEANKHGFKNARQDSLGLQTIVYWPYIEYKKQ